MGDTVLAWLVEQRVTVGQIRAEVLSDPDGLSSEELIKLKAITETEESIYRMIIVRKDELSQEGVH